MTIKIKDKDTNLNLWLPNNLIFSKHLWKFIIKKGDSDESDPDDNLASLVEKLNLTPEYIKEIKKSLSIMKKNYPELPLVEVHSADGACVLIMP